MIWRHHHDAAALATIRAALAVGSPVVIEGPAGIGKTSLARAVVGELGRPSIWVVAAESIATTPLGAMTVAVPGRVVDPASAVRALADELSRTDAILVVDDIQFLDAASAAVLAAIVDSVVGCRQAPVVMTGRCEGEVSVELVEVLDRAGTTTVTVEALDLASTTAIVEGYLHGALDVVSAQRLFVTSEGNPFYLRQLVAGALASGHLERITDGRWVLGSAFVVTDEMRGATASALSAAGPRTYALLQFLSLMSPLPMDVVRKLGCADAFTEPRAGDFIVTDGGLTHCAHPVFVEVVRNAMGAIERNHLTTRLVEQLGAMRLTRAQRLGRAQLAVSAGIPLGADELVKCARFAHTHGDRGLAEDLARTAVAAGAGPDAILLQARAISSQGRAREADDLIAAVDPDSLGEMDLTVYAVALASNRLTYLDDPVSAAELIDKFEPMLVVPQLRLVLTSLRGSILMSTGRLAEAVSFTQDVLTDPMVTEFSSATAGYGLGEALYHLGRPGEAVHVATRTLETATAADPLISMAVRTTIAQSMAVAGRLEEAQTWAEDFLGETVGLPVEQAAACNALSTIALAAGRLDDARRFAVAARSGFVVDDLSGMRSGANYLLALSAAYSGDVAAARTAADECARLVGVGRNGVRVFAGLADVLAQTVIGELTNPMRRVREIADAALAEERLLFAVQSLYWGVRLGDEAAARGLIPLARRCDGDLIPLYIDHATAVQAKDVVALEKVSDDFDRLGYRPLAADALAQAIARLVTDGELRRARHLRVRLAEICSACDGLSTPAIRAAAFDVHLSVRELEVSALFDAGLGRREVAGMLGLAVATVDGHLARARIKRGEM